MTGSLAIDRTQPDLGAKFSLMALFLLVFTVAQVREGAAFDVGVSAGAVGLGAGASASVGSDGLSAGAGLGSGGNRASASGGLGRSGIGGDVDTAAGGASASAGAGSHGLSAGGGASAGRSGASVGAAVGSNGMSGALGVDIGPTGVAANAGMGTNGVSAGGSASGAVNTSGSGSSRGAGHSPAGNGTLTGGSMNSAGLATNGSAISATGFDGTGSSASRGGAHLDQHAPSAAPTPGLLANIAPTVPPISSLSGTAIPRSLLPVQNGGGDGGWFRSIYLLKPLRPKPGTPLSVVQSCRDALVSGAVRYGAMHVDVASAGRASHLKDGSLSAPVEARILFQRGSLVQIRQARVTCRMDQAGRVTAIF